MQKATLSEWFHDFAKRSAALVGSPLAFLIAAVTVVLWIVMGPHFGYSDTWQLVINTSTTIVTFLIVFLIQNTQNRDARAIHLKLDEVIKSLRGARNSLIDLEDCTEEELDRLEEQFKLARKKSRGARKANGEKG